MKKILLLLAMFTFGCGEGVSPVVSAPDSGVDAGTDAGVDAGCHGDRDDDDDHDGKPHQCPLHRDGGHGDDER